MALLPWPESRRERLVKFKIFEVLKIFRNSPRTGAEHGFFVVDTWDWVNVLALIDAAAGDLDREPGRTLAILPDEHDLLV